MNFKINTLALIAISASLFSCNSNKEKQDAENNNSKYTINVSYMDTTTSPTKDFFQFANGTWIKNNPVPASESRWGSFNELDKINKEKLTTILDEAIEKEAEKGSDMQIIGDYYAAMKNKVARKKNCDEEMQNIKQDINKLQEFKDLPKVLFDMKSKGITGFYSLYVGQDLKNVENHVLNLSQGGLGMPNREYYMDESKKEIQNAYIDFMTKVFDYFGYKNPEKKAHSTYSLEKEMAKNMMKPAELRVPENTYNPISISNAHQYSSFLDLQKYINTFGNDEVDSLILGQPKYLNALKTIINESNFENIKNYITWKYINHYSSYLNTDLVNFHFDFYGKTLSGKKEMKPINEQAIEEMTNKAVKTALAKEFVARHFSEEAKEKVNTMVDHLLTVYEQRLNNLEWMTDRTKAEALKKLNAIGRKLGYPDEWKDLSALSISPDNYISNIDACNHFSYMDNMSKLTKKVNKNEWGMPAHMVNAYYHPLLNEIAFPAGIMQPPFFDVDAEDAVNYGGIGMVIGHEFTHGFDDMGSKFAADGSFTNWWSEEDRENFENRTARLGKTFADFCPIDGHCVNPELTMGENIADLGGITMAYHAYKMTEEYKSNKMINGYTPSQRFFIAYAQLWKINYTDAELKKRIATDPHSPGKYRVNGPLMNSPEFFKAFNVKEGDPMRKNEKEISKIW
ncbi:hypothetical protein CW751_08860 [Brumimicrobium salinarum]|uniref:Peptidase M13 n=1 Tax=Brumimicrobium salinarum TaxID=2058658 RepID=A0A2I0R1M8_9FLAO|nr:M13 family metallopeptidase [Brumimicrobium salinarum]PKR80477.1 hypothetical protein CW751_08860 [Brumimicrobium salinarum]